MIRDDAQLVQKTLLGAEVLNPQTATSPDGKTLATGRTLWDLSTGRRKDPVLHNPNVFLSCIGTTAIKNVLSSPDGRTLAISGFNTVMLFDVATGTLLHTINDMLGGPRMMKLRRGNTVIETDHIEYTQKLSSGMAKRYFTSGYTLDVVCGIKSTDPRAATFDRTAGQFLDTIENTDRLKQDREGKR